MRTEIAILDNSSAHRAELIYQTKKAGAEVTLFSPFVDENFEFYDGVIVSGGTWNEQTREERRPYISWYKEKIPKIQKPLLGICQGMLLLAYTYNKNGKKFVRNPNRLGDFVTVHFYDGFPFARGEMKLYHSTLTTVDSVDERFLKPCAASAQSKVEAVTHVSEPKFGVLTHPEVTRNRKISPIIKNFVEFCRNYKST